MFDTAISASSETDETVNAAPDTRSYEQKCTALEFMEYVVYNYISDSMLSSRYGWGMKFSDRATARFGAIAGWIVGMAQSGQREFAERAAHDIDAKLRFLASYGRVEEIETERGIVRVPLCKVALTDDGTFGGFSFCVYRASVRTGQPSERRNRDLEEFVTQYERAESGELRAVYDSCGYVERAFIDYNFAFNGGLLYHGPRRSETYSVSLDKSALWGVHT
jgi:hypothetical protein